MEKLEDRTIYHIRSASKKGEEGGSKKRIIELEEEKHRDIVNVYFVESYKKYNAMDIDEEQNSNSICKCAIF